jgi:hypothetical protein
VTPEQVAADRAAMVREAAVAWRASGLIDEAGERAVRDLHPDDRVRVGTAFRVLLGIFAGGAGLAAMALAIMVTDSAAATWLLAPGLVALTEALIGPGRRAQGGIEEGLSFAAWVTVIVACFWLGEKGLDLRDQGVFRLVLSGAAAMAGLAAWRWGMPFHAIAGTACLLVLLGTVDGGRWLVLGAAVAAFPVLSYGRGHPRVSPSHRQCLDWSLVACSVAALLSINYYTLDHHWLERARDYQAAGDEVGLVVRLVSVLGTILLPLATLRRAITTRDRLLLWFGLLGLGAAGLTLRAYVHLAPLWLLLILVGLIVLGLAAVAHRYLLAGPAGERAGITARPLGPTDHLKQVVEIAGTVASLTPTAPPPAAEPGFKGEGGRFGGGGASESF